MHFKFMNRIIKIVYDTVYISASMCILQITLNVIYAFKVEKFLALSNQQILKVKRLSKQYR